MKRGKNSKGDKLKKSKKIIQKQTIYSKISNDNFD